MTTPHIRPFSASLCLAGLLLALGPGASASDHAAPNHATPDHAPADAAAPDHALERLMQGNQRFVSGHPSHPDQSTERRAELAKGQTPFAIVLTCADSRVVPELYFDQGLGDIFVVRNAGHVLDDHVLGSLEYAVEHLHAPLIIVVGHEKCGAVAAAVKGGHAEGHVASLLEAIAPAVAWAGAKPGDKVDNVVRTHAHNVADTLLRAGPILSVAVKAGHLKVVAARYDLDTGAVEILR